MTVTRLHKTTLPLLRSRTNTKAHTHSSSSSSSI